MQLGYTIPLQRWLKMKAPPRGQSWDLRFCWELHILHPNGVPSLFATHASSRYALLLYGLSQGEWGDLPPLFAEKLRAQMAADGFALRRIDRYFQAAGEGMITGTHGRRPVAFLNRAVDDFYTLPAGLEESSLEQPLISGALNAAPCRAAGFGSELGRAAEFFARDLHSL